MTEENHYYPVPSADVAAHPQGGHELDKLPFRTVYIALAITTVVLVVCCWLWALSVKATADAVVESYGQSSHDAGTPAQVEQASE